jgi:hypothetical protein
MTKIVKLREIAFTRSGDKNDTSNVGVIPFRAEDYELVKEQVTVERVQELFAGAAHGPVTRYELPGIASVNFLLEQALGGGVSRSLALDTHGKNYGSLMLHLDVEVPDDQPLRG